MGDSQLTEALEQFDNEHALGKEEADALWDAARRWWSFPTEADIERAAKAIYETDERYRVPWEHVNGYVWDRYRRIARAALEAARKDTE